MAKQVIVVRRDLEMGTGKIVGQACHACLGASEETRKHDPSLWRRWLAEGAKKIVVKVYSLEELLELEREAKKFRLPNSLVVDRGLTQLPPDTPTALGIGPAEDELIDRITGKLKLL
ncbi:MAG: peptidyl-tRNA hydrolase Pth2 [Candidatus Bathyarchaeota archaeon]